MSADASLVAGAEAAFARRARWRPYEYAIWAAAFASFFLLPGHHLILAEIAILALFAVSLDLVLGYLRIVSLGHAAFLGVGAYAAGLFAKHGMAEPVAGLAVAAAAAAILGFAASFLVLRGSDLTRLMVTLGVALMCGELANRMAWLTGGADGLQGVVMGPVLGLFPFDLQGRTAYGYSLVTLFLLFLLTRRVTVSTFGLTLRAIHDNPLRAAAVGAPVNRIVVAVYTFAAALAGVAGGLLAQTTQYVSLDVFDFARSADVMLVLVIGGVGYLYGGIVGAIFFKIAADLLSAQTPQYWHFWIGLILVVLVLVGRERFGAHVGRLGAQAARLLPGGAAR